MTDILTLPQAEALAAHTLAAIEQRDKKARDRMGTRGGQDSARRGRRDHARCDTDRERVASDLAGLRLCWETAGPGSPAITRAHARRYSDGLRRTAALYGVT